MSTPVLKSRRWLRRAMLVACSAGLTFVASATCWLTVDTGGLCCDGITTWPHSAPGCPAGSITSNPPIEGVLSDPCGRPNRVSGSCTCTYAYYLKDGEGQCYAVVLPIPTADEHSEGLWCPCDPQ